LSIDATSTIPGAEITYRLTDDIMASSKVKGGKRIFCRDRRGQMIDYRRLLVKYIRYIVEMEGTDYLGYEQRNPIFSEVEWNELRKLTEEEIDYAGIDCKELLIKYIQYDIQKCNHDEIFSEGEWKELSGLAEEVLKRIE